VTYLVDFTDGDGKRRTVSIRTKHDLAKVEYAHTLAAYYVDTQTGYAVTTIHSVTEAK